MTTLARWIKEHPGVNALDFERNYRKSFNFGRFEELCGFCLASHYFEGEPPIRCRPSGLYVSRDSLLASEGGPTRNSGQRGSRHCHRVPPCDIM